MGHYLCKYGTFYVTAAPVDNLICSMVVLVANQTVSFLTVVYVFIYID